MWLRNTSLCFLVALGSITAVPALAGVNLSIDIGVPPPPARVEVVPAPRLGYVWAPGYWQWDGQQQVWVTGRWIVARRGHHWVPGRWVEVERGRHYHFEPGHWERDRHHY